MIVCAKNCKKNLGGQPAHVDMDIHIIKNITVKYSRIKISTLPCAYPLSICTIHIVYFSSSKMENEVFWFRLKKKT